jgi:hypothetical protein
MSEKYPLWRRPREEIFSQLIRNQWGPYVPKCNQMASKIPNVRMMRFGNELICRGFNLLFYILYSNALYRVELFYKQLVIVQ